MLCKVNFYRVYRYFFLLIVFSSTANLAISQSLTPGSTYYDSTGFVAYLVGDLPVVISVPHGGYLEPDSIPDRSCTGCVYARDLYTQEIGREMADAFFEETGCYPHLVINLLHRKKFDANRSIETAADGHPVVEQAWYGYHAFIDSAKAQIISHYGRGLFLDLHGHGHAIQRIELGYLLSAAELGLSDALLNSHAYIMESSIRTLTGDNIEQLSHGELLRGAHSLGSLLDAKGFPAVPSQADPFPMVGESYFDGGYNTQRHGSRDNGGDIDGVQVECNRDIRIDDSLRAMLIDSLTATINQYINLHYNDQYSGQYCHLISGVSVLEPHSDLVLSPNPATDNFNIISDLEALEVAMYNSLGQKLHSIHWQGDPIDIRFLRSGYYIVEVKKGALLLGTKKLIKL